MRMEGVVYKTCVRSMLTYEAEEIKWFRHIVRRDEEVEIKKVLELKIKEQRKRGRPVKQWIDVIEEDMKKRGVVQQDAGDREGWKRAVKGLANPR